MTTAPSKEAIVSDILAGRTSAAEMEEMYGIPASRIRKWCQRAREKTRISAPTPPIVETVEVDPTPPKTEPFMLGGSPADRKIVALEEQVRRLRKSLKEAHRQALDDDAMREILGSMVAEPVRAPDWTLKSPTIRTKLPEVPVAMWTDWHLGETVSRDETNGRNEYNAAIAEARVHRVVENTIDVARHHGPGNYPGIVIALGGDFVSGGLHPELQKTDEFEILPSALKCRDILVAAIDRMKAEFGSVYLPAVCGNHGRMTHKPEFKRYIYKNADWLIYQMLIRHYADDPTVVIDCRPANEILYRVYGLRVLLMHGDMMGVKGGDGIIGALGPIARGEVKVRGYSFESYDFLQIGHWHQELWLPRTIVSNTLKGYDEFARLALRAPATPPSQPLFFVHPERGITSRWSIAAEEKPTPADAPWLQVFQAAA
ncbi:hypothetical protein [Aurantimonas coralicida]|uniref:hypothetical protein n=1 Tax=Aurantimonas coralicida TaxID=182270 RepID=UPI0003FA48E1|nr:hypothetical protein [Aurantimonas coralicida]MCC4298458.1 hypothetical protein [Aurantimonas coralicida]